MTDGVWLKNMLLNYANLMEEFRKKEIYITSIKEEYDVPGSSKRTVIFTFSWGMKELERLLDKEAKDNDYILEMPSNYGLIRFVEDEIDYDHDFSYEEK